MTIRCGTLLFIALATLAAPAAGGGGRPLPPGHPPLGAPPSAPTAPRAPQDRHAITWTVPAAWTVETPASPMRRAQYRLPGPGGPGECAVFYFGPGQGGDARSNVERWAGQFRPPDGRPPGAAVTTRKLTVGGLPVLVVETSGTYVGGMPGGPAGPERSDYMLLGAIVEGPDANWFFKATGPRKTLQAQRGAFEGMIRSVRPVGGGSGR